jgi:hypothetical protein
MAILGAMESPNTYHGRQMRRASQPLWLQRVRGGRGSTSSFNTRLMKSSYLIIASLALSVATSMQAATPKTSGVYLTAADYTNRHLAFEGDCRSKAHRLELHDVLNKPYIDVTHESDKRRYSKSELFGFRACDGHDYRFSSKLEYLILESRELYIYAQDIKETHGKGMPQTIRKYYFSAGPAGEILAMTLDNLKHAFPNNHKFHDLLDSNFSAGQGLEEYDEFHKTFKVNRLLIASRE